jgi:transcriptional regulator GlxA family with amidase domain
MVSVVTGHLTEGFDTNVLWLALIKHRLIRCIVSPNMDAMTMQQQIPAAPPPRPPGAMMNIDLILQHAITPQDSAREDARVTSARSGGLSSLQARLALAYIESNLESKLETRAIAKAVALSKSHFGRAFKVCVGCSPMTYVSIRRVELAKRLLICTRQRLTDIALACGFFDQPHFNRQFVRSVGMSPGSWRRSVGACA